MRPKIRDSVIANWDPDAREAQFILTTLSQRVVFDAEPWVPALLALLDGTRPLDAVIATMQADYGIATDDVTRAIDALISSRLVVDAQELPGMTGSPRYERQQRLLEELAADGVAKADAHERIRAASVLVVGVGGTGSWVASSLVAAGIGRLTLVDHDVVEVSNLGRQLLYATSDIATPKLSAATRRLESLNPDVQVTTVDCLVDGPHALRPHLHGVDIAISCADEPSVNEASSHVAEAAQDGGVTHLVGSGYSFSLGLLGTSVIPGSTPCWSCARSMAELDTGTAETLVKPVRGRAGGLATAAAVVGNLLAWEALLHIIGGTPVLAGRLTEIDLLNFAFRHREIERRKQCACVVERSAVPA